MTTETDYRALIEARLRDLGLRMREIDDELGHEMDKDLSEQAVDIEDDEVLESLGAAAQREIALLRAALKRIEAGTYGICLTCGGEISQARLAAVPYAPLCRTCAGAASHGS